MNDKGDKKKVRRKLHRLIYTLSVNYRHQTGGLYNYVRAQHIARVLLNHAESTFVRPFANFIRDDYVNLI